MCKNEKTFTFGANRAEVSAIMGRGGIYSIAQYGDSWIKYNEGRATEWDNKGELKISFGEPIQNPNPISLGSTIEDIGKAIGTPIRIINGSCEFLDIESEIFVEENGTVSGWDIKNGEIPVFMGDADPDAPPFKIGSTLEDVIKANGTPNTYKWWGHKVKYGNSEVGIHEGRVFRINNIDGNLKCVM